MVKEVRCPKCGKSSIRVIKDFPPIIVLDKVQLRLEEGHWWRLKCIVCGNIYENVDDIIDKILTPGRQLFWR